MRKNIILGFILLGFSILVGGCAPPHARYAAEINASLKNINNVIFAYKKVQQAEHVKNVQSEVKELVDKLKENKTRVDEATPTDDKVKEKVLKKYSDSLESILSNLDTENKRVSSLGLSPEVYKMTDDIIKSFKTLERPDSKSKTKK